MSDKFVFSCFPLCFACLCVVLKHCTQMFSSQIYALGLVTASCFLVVALVDIHSLVKTILCVCVFAAASEHASLRCAQKSSAVARNCQHQSDRGSRPAAHGCQWPQRPLCQIQDGPPEVQEQGNLGTCHLTAEPCSLIVRFN